MHTVMPRLHQIALVICVLIATLTFASPLTVVPQALHRSEYCTPKQMSMMPCRCCKMMCWYTVAKSATHELGHVPGQAGEHEALATLKLIRICMITECANVCVSSSPPAFLLAAAARVQPRE